MIKINRSVKRFFINSSGNREFIGRDVRYTKDEESKNVSIPKSDLEEYITYQQLVDYLEAL